VKGIAGSIVLSTWSSC